VVVSVVGNGVALAADDTPGRNILFFGNSFTMTAGGVEKIVRDIAVAAGEPEPYVRAAAVGGQSLDFFLHPDVWVIDAWAPPGETWDTVVIQEHSLKPTSHPTGGDPADFRADALMLYEKVLMTHAGVNSVLFETWARAPGHEFYPDIFQNPSAMQNELRDNYRLAEADIDAAHGAGAAAVAPVGEGFRESGWRDLYADDLWHANQRGGLLIGLILYGTIYGDRTVSDIDLSGVASGLGLGAGDAEALSAVADAVLVPGVPGALALLGFPMLHSPRRR
jgi:hypothetical protein